MGQYRVIAEYDLKTNDFPREYDGSLCENDLYIKCAKGRIYYLGKGVLQFYCPSVKKFNNIVRLIQDAHKDNLISEIRTYDEEGTFNFNNKHFEALVEYLAPSTYGAGIKPFSVKNLPKSNYKIPKDDLQRFQIIINKYSNPLLIGLVTKEYIASITSKKRPLEKIKADMRLNKMKPKEYIHFIGHWKQYLDFIERKVR